MDDSNQKHPFNILSRQVFFYGRGTNVILRFPGVSPEKIESLIHRQVNEAGSGIAKIHT